MKRLSLVLTLALLSGCASANYAWVNHNVSEHGYAERFHGDRGDCWSKSIQAVPLPQSYGPQNRDPSSYSNLATSLTNLQNDSSARKNAEEAAGTRKQLFFDCMEGRGWSFEETKEEPKH